MTNAQRLYGPPIAEHVIGMMLAFSRGLPAYLDAQREGRWDPAAGTSDGRGTWLVEGKTMLVVGLGGIGTEIARRAHALGMHVLATLTAGGRDRSSWSTSDSRTRP